MDPQSLSRLAKNALYAKKRHAAESHIGQWVSLQGRYS